MGVIWIGFHGVILITVAKIIRAPYFSLRLAARLTSVVPRQPRSWHQRSPPGVGYRWCVACRPRLRSWYLWCLAVRSAHADGCTLTIRLPLGP